MLNWLRLMLRNIKEGHPNSYRYQRNWAKRYIKANDDLYSDSWGRVGAINPGLGDYLKISVEIRDLARPYPKEVIDLGCLDGKWSMELAKNCYKVHCVDLSDELHDLLRLRLKDKMGVFYKTKGFELEGFSDDSVDVVFSMDSLVRCPLIDIKSYFKEFYRILRRGGGSLYTFTV